MTAVPASPYHRFQVHRNPFGELTRSERAALAVIDRLDDYHQHLHKPLAALQFVGECGFGKTTHLLALSALLPTS